MKTLTLDITQKDIDLGRMRCGIQCPVALALGRIGQTPRVGISLFYIDGKAFYTNQALRNFIIGFDQDKTKCKRKKIKINLIPAPNDGYCGVFYSNDRHA